MEFNKAEVVKIKQITENKISEHDYQGAMRFAQEAQNLYPQLEGLSHMLEVLKMYITGERRIHNQQDYYAILGSVPWAGPEGFRKAYLKKVLCLHPDKNKCEGAHGAFQLLQEAYKVLNDDASRLAYHEKLNPPAPKNPPQWGAPYSSTSTTGNHNSTSSQTWWAQAERTQGGTSVPAHHEPSGGTSETRPQVPQAPIYTNETQAPKYSSKRESSVPQNPTNASKMESLIPQAPKDINKMGSSVSQPPRNKTGSTVPQTPYNMAETGPSIPQPSNKTEIESSIPRHSDNPTETGPSVPRSPFHATRTRPSVPTPPNDKDDTRPSIPQPPKHTSRTRPSVPRPERRTVETGPSVSQPPNDMVETGPSIIQPPRSMTGTEPSVPQPPKISTEVGPSVQPANEKPNTFWTKCRCKTRFEYEVKYLNQLMRCHRCRRIFMAFETAPPPAPHYPFSQLPIPEHRSKRRRRVLKTNRNRNT